MRRLIFFFFFLVVYSTSLFSQNVSPRKPQIEKASALSKKAGAFIDINAPGYNESNFNITQLVKDVLISSGTNSCITPNVSNVQVSPNLPASDANRSWGYFHKGTTNFPFKDGIVLSTGYAVKGGNSLNTSTLGDNLPTGSDPDLVAATNPSGSLNDAVILEFDFVPTSSQVKFNYLFASEEYTGSFPCSFSDAFALLLKPVAGGPYINMAVLPGGAGPVSVTNIHPATQFNGSTLSCGAANANFFGGYNNANIETNFNGRTIPLTATATVVPGQAYHFKMVLADAIDSSYDSAVFLEGGSFNIGVELLDPNGATLPESINVCDNVPQVLTASVNDPIMTFQWFYNGVAIPGATTNTITAVQPGIYTIEVSVPGNPCPGKASIEIHGGTTPLAQDATFLLCTTPDITTFDLSDAMPLISPTTGAVFHFYENQADAQAQNNNYITNILNYNGSDGQILYVVVSNGGFCSKLVELKLLKEVTPTAHVSSSRVKICPGESVTLKATGGNTYLWSNFSGTGDTQTVTLHQTTTFNVYAIGVKGCKSLQPATVTVEVTDEIISTLKDVEFCMGDRVTLDAGTGTNYKYLWSTGASTQTIEVNQPGIYSVEIDNGYCKKTFTAKVMVAALPYFTNITYSDDHKLTVIAENPPINNIQGVLEYSIDNGISWQESNVFTNLLDNTNYTIFVRIKGTSCVGTIDFFTLKIVNIITPNEDGVNDKLDLTALGNFKNFEGSIYDRYGVELFKFSKERPVWDGTIGGKRVSTGTYWYKFSFNYEKSKVRMERSGWILLKNRE
ncbi:choice-of-anchor L domain-containing protein [Chryseobacterium oryctis]|uniref:Choice-of-anchor L domain-containing protein n=1 Tax=Chryseobacterium oryctis TaxID=2952618 RepID=A0ABT3HN30_9FLAO|nr:choice-of-anchor L domain-containing protein [Chryseobacterium oryctis]MCW3161164.1 choice-of-anchor L domain-containing protein [Chryseobacterium oryctis]